MSWWQALVKAAASLFLWWREVSDEKKKNMEKARDEGKKAVDDGDASGVTASLARMRRK